MSRYVEFFSNEMEALVQKYQYYYEYALSNEETINCIEQEMAESNAQACLLNEILCKRSDIVVTESCWSESEESFWHTKSTELENVRINQCELYGEMIKIIEIYLMQKARCKVLTRELSKLSVGIRDRRAVARLQDTLQILSQKSLT